MRTLPLLSPLALAALAALAPLAAAQSGSLDVDAKSNIFGYGVSTPTNVGGGGVVAPSIALAPGTTSFTFFATGLAGWQNVLLNGPDGGGFAAATNLSALGPISGYAAPLSGHLVGLFIPAGNLAGLAAPARFTYPNAAALTAPSYAPALRQVFFIGDGLAGTGSGAPQTFVVPTGASRLVLGIADGFGFSGSPGAYDDNVGSYSVRYAATPVPEPASLATLMLGGLALFRRRRGQPRSK